jgi:hypothetical protein
MSGTESLKAQVQALADRIAILEDIEAIRNLHYAYGYFIDKCMYDEVVDLFSDNGRALFLNGVYKGKAGARRLYCGWFRTLFTRGKNGPAYGFLLDHHLFQEIIHVAPDRKTAKGRARNFMLGGQHRWKTDRIEGLPDGFWEGGIYENTYVREDGVWKLGVLNYNMLWQANYSDGVEKSEAHLMALTKTYPEDPNGPDELMPGGLPVWPETRVVPFHYNHPVTGKTIAVPAPGLKPKD